MKGLGFEVRGSRSEEGETSDPEPRTSNPLGEP